MLKTLESTESTTKPAKGGVGVGGDGGGDSGDDDSHDHSPQCLERAYQQTHQLAQPKLWLSMMGLIMVVVAVVILT